MQPRQSHVVQYYIEYLLCCYTKLAVYIIHVNIYAGMFICESYKHKVFIYLL